MGEALLDLGLDGVVVGGAGVVAVGGDVLEARVGLEELGGGDGGGVEGAAGGELAVVGVGDLAGEGGGVGEAGGELGGGELVEVGVRDADVDDVGADVGDVEGEVAGDGALEGEVPLLDVAGAGVAVDGVDGLAEAGAGR